MKQAFRAKPLWAAAVLFGLTALILAFQNCTQNLGNEEVTSFADKVEFAYEMKADQLSYLSCDGLASNSSGAHFTFQIGAHNSNSGVRVSEDFLHETRFQSTSERIKTLAEGDANQTAFVQMAIRRKDNLYSTYNSSTPRQGEDYDILLGRLDDSPVADRIVSGDYVRSVSGFPEGEASRDFVGNLRFLVNTNDAQTLRDDLNSRASLVALTFGDTRFNDEMIPRDDKFDDERLTPFGYGLELSFGATPGSNRRMSIFREIDLKTGSATGLGSSWTCQRYEVVRRHEAATFCNIGGNNVTSDPHYAAAQRAMPNGWDFGDGIGGADTFCVVPPSVNDRCYNLANNLPVLRNDTCTDSTNCPHYLSVCVKR